MLHLLLFGLLLLLLLIFGIFVWPVIWIARIFSQSAADKIAHWFVRTACKAGRLGAGVKMDARGLENLDNEDAVVYVINHRSIFDIITTYPYFKKPTGFVAKKELAGIPVFSYWLKLANGLFLDRQNIREGLKTILQAIEKIKAGTSMVIFPEGIRNKDQESLTTLLEFHDASFKLAEKTGAKIVPIALYNTANCFENHKPWMYSTKVKMTVGTPIDIKDLSPEHRKFLGKYVQSVMQDMMNVYAAEEQAK